MESGVAGTKSSNNKLMDKYGITWPDTTNPLEIEREMIRRPGSDLMAHHKAMQFLCWPEDYQNRTTDAILDCLINERITVVYGHRDSCKTRTASKFFLCDYWCFPNETLVLMTSTTAQMLELRIWGDIKSLFDRAREYYPWLEGNIVDARKGLFTDNPTTRGEVRDMRKGMIGIPVVTGEGDYSGEALKNYAGIKQKRRRLVCDESQHVSADYLKVLFAMNSGDFKGAFLGNMIPENGKALDKVAEPEGGWGSEGEIKKSGKWRNKYGGITLNLVGTDCPNLDPATRDHYPGMLSQSAIDQAKKIPDYEQSIEWVSQILGVRKVGVVSDRVLTVEQVRVNDGFKNVIWNAQPWLRVLGIDAGFGGDECVATCAECGEEVGGRKVILFAWQKIIPVTVGPDVEDRIAMAAKEMCDENSIPYENVFIEAGMRATLAVSFGVILSPAINAINFGGSATERPVSNDLYVDDEQKGGRRLKKASEHYSKFVSELCFAAREVVVSKQARLFPMVAAEELQRRKWKYTDGNRYEVESKLLYKARNSGRSPNFSDSVIIALEGARRLGFVIERMRDPDASDDNPRQDEWFDRELDKQKQNQKKRELTYD